MGHLFIDQSKITQKTAGELVALCPFQALEYEENRLALTPACKLCMACTRHKSRAISFIEDSTADIDFSAYHGIGFYAQIDGQGLHPVSMELLGKATELASAGNLPVFALIIGHNTQKHARLLARLGADFVYTYDDECLARFDIERYSAAVCDFVSKAMPSALLFGATAKGRLLAPFAASRLKTGITADCTALSMEGDALIQTRPAFGGNVMARIITPHSRPAICTVRYRVFDAPQNNCKKTGEIVNCPLPKEAFVTKTNITDVSFLPPQIDITKAETIVAIGRGMATEKGIELAESLARALGGQIACSRPLAEGGFFDSRRQIGLSGRSVKPKTIITLGVSGAVQFAAGIWGCPNIIAVNSDKNAPIFDIAHTCIIGDGYEIVKDILSCAAALKEGSLRV